MIDRFYIKNHDGTDFVHDNEKIMQPVLCRTYKEAINLTDFLNKWIKE